jgi:hypothetical protein
MDEEARHQRSRQHELHELGYVQLPSHEHDQCSDERDQRYRHEERVGCA